MEILKKKQVKYYLLIGAVLILAVAAVFTMNNKNKSEVAPIEVPVIVADIEDIPEEIALDIVIDDESTVDESHLMTLEKIEVGLKDPDFKAALYPKVEVVQLCIDDTVILLASPAEAEAVLETSIEMLLAPDHQAEVSLSVEDEGLVVDFEVLDESVCAAELSSVELLETVVIETTEAYKNEIMTVDAAVDYITKVKDTAKIYTVVSGDVPSIIAEKNDMGLSELYAINPDLESTATCLQIGDDITVMVPEPELSLMTTEIDEYSTAIPKGYDYQSDDNTYVGTTKTLSGGANGVKEVTATVAKVNGSVVSRSITNERVLQEPVNAVILNGAKALPAKGTIGTFISPLSEYRLSSSFGARWNSLHRGIDLAVPTGTNVRASDGGVVSYSGWSGSYGYLIEIDHGNGVKTRYAHNSALLVSKGEAVSQYQVVARSGNTGNSTGPHCHFEILLDGTPVNPLDYLE